MVALTPSVEDLVAAATSGAEPRTLRRVVQKVLDGFDAAPEAARGAAVRTIGRALAGAEGRGAQVLCLALGALVEAGASPELAWPAVGRGLGELLDEATAFAAACVKRSKQPLLDAAVEAVGAQVAKKNPSKASAWNALPSRCLAAVACLTRSKKLRARTRKDEELAASAWPLSDAVAEVGSLLQALRIVDDEELLVLAPELGRGWRVALDAISSNAELYILLGDALVGDPKKGRLAGKRPDPRAIASVRDGAAPKRGATSVTLPFELIAVAAVAHDGSLPRSTAHDEEHEISPDGSPADLLAGKRPAVLLQRASHAHPIAVTPSFEGLRPEVRVVEELSPDAVGRAMKRLARSAAMPAARR